MYIVAPSIKRYFKPVQELRSKTCILYFHSRELIANITEHWHTILTMYHFDYYISWYTKNYLLLFIFLYFTVGKIRFNKIWNFQSDINLLNPFDFNEYLKPEEYWILIFILILILILILICVEILFLPDS